jgi:hypothetical protein
MAGRSGRTITNAFRTTTRSEPATRGSSFRSCIESGCEFQAGYSFTAEDADESRFVLSSPAQPYPPGDPHFSTEGHYAPYYTPSHVVTHSVIAAAAVRAGQEYHAPPGRRVRVFTQPKMCRLLSLPWDRWSVR